MGRQLLLWLAYSSPIVTFGGYIVTYRLIHKHMKAVIKDRDQLAKRVGELTEAPGSELRPLSRTGFQIEGEI